MCYLCSKIEIIAGIAVVSDQDQTPYSHDEWNQNYSLGALFGHTITNDQCAWLWIFQKFNIMRKFPKSFWKYITVADVFD